MYFPASVNTFIIESTCHLLLGAFTSMMLQVFSVISLMNSSSSSTKKLVSSLTIAIVIESYILRYSDLLEESEPL